MRREEVVGGGMGAIKATSANGWTQREKVEGADAWARSEQAEGRDIGPGKVSRNIRVSTGGFYGTTRSSFLMEVPMEPKVSIIVPVYNAEKSLARCVDSILNQEFRDFELILMDDGSKDRSGEICDGYARADARVVVVHKENTGVSDTRNQAIARARGTFLQFVDSDDWLTADATKLMVRAAEETGCDMVIADFYRVVGEMVSQKGDIDADQVIGREAFVGFMMENPADYYYGVLWNKLYRRSLVEAHGIRMDAKLSWCEDFLFNLEYVRYATTFYALRQHACFGSRPTGFVADRSGQYQRGDGHGFGVCRRLSARRSGRDLGDYYPESLVCRQETERLKGTTRHDYLCRRISCKQSGYLRKEHQGRNEADGQAFRYFTCMEKR